MSSSKKAIFVEELRQQPLAEQPLEVVERKGIGHPDTICDGVVEEFSHALALEYWKRFHDILHYNVDKAFLRAGSAEQQWGGGRITRPMLLILGDRATSTYESEVIDVGGIGIGSAKSWIRKNIFPLHDILDPDKHIEYQVEIEQGSRELSGIVNEGATRASVSGEYVRFSEKNRVLSANDTSATVGYAPLSLVERMTYHLERHLNSKSFKEEHPEVGEDIKVMSVRNRKSYDVTVAAAFVDRYVTSEEDYFRKKEVVKQEINDYLTSNFIEGHDLELSLNALDRKGKGLHGVYLTVTGTSAEDADSGEVGRGNRVDGVISLNRPASNEAAAGKNTVSHVGLIYNVLSFELAHAIHAELGEKGVKEVYVWMVSQIGRPVRSPKNVTVQLVLSPTVSMSSLQGEVDELVSRRLDQMPQFIDELTNKRSDDYIEAWMGPTPETARKRSCP
ncbi:MAG: methionine adenosyltransferase [Thermoprotei archaeon]